MKQFIQNSHQDRAIDSLKRLVNIPSYLQESIPSAPFGKDILDSLKECLTLFKEEGFQTFIDPDGYYGFAEIGEGEEIFGILCHLDVVPAGDESLWLTPAFEGTIRDNAIVGRGVQDDKGPTIAALYAVKAILESGEELNKTIRFIFGTDEENLWRCMEEYHKKEVGVTMGIAPDANFPVIYAEKGLLQVYLTGEGSKEFTVNGGQALNVVPDTATYNGNKTDEVIKELDKLGFNYELNNQEIIVKGQAIHSKDAPEGVNANTRLAEALSTVYDHSSLAFLGKLVKQDANGKSVFGDVRDDASGALTFNLATVLINENETKIGIDMRIPVTISKDELAEKLEQVAKNYELNYQEHDYLAPLYVPAESELVTTLLKAYQDVTGDLTTKPQISGGATFARTMENCVAFGAMFEHTKDTMHQANETWQLDEMKRTMEIYAEAIYRLCV